MIATIINFLFYTYFIFLEFVIIRVKESEKWRKKLNIGQILSVSIPSLISIVGFWISIYNIKKNSQENYKGMVSKLVFEKRLEYFDSLCKLLADLSNLILENNEVLKIGMLVNIKMNSLKDENYKVTFDPDKINKEQVLSAIKKMKEIGNNLDSQITRYYPYIPQEFVVDKHLIHTPLKDYLNYSTKQFSKIFNDKPIKESDLEKLHGYFRTLLLSIYQQETEVKKEFDKYEI